MACAAVRSRRAVREDTFLTSRQLGESAIKIIGVYFGASAALAVMRLLASFAVPPIEGLPAASELAVANSLPIAGLLGIAAVCLFGAEGIATRLFPATRIDVASLSRRDLLTVGLVVLGVGTALDGIPDLLQLAGKAVWYAERSRQAMFLPSMEQSWDHVVRSALTVVVGVGLAKLADTLAAKLDRGKL
jgi:hypothetical protein